MPLNATLPILVVDDNKTMVRITTELLRQVGYLNVDGAADGSQALAMAAKKTYDLVISDWNMAEVSGLDLLRALKPRPSDQGPRFIMATAESKTDRIVQARVAGVDAYIVKPFTAQTLRVKIESLFPRAPPAQGASGQ
jgi:two-component system, chemotaxis family, chemotaxis protein CheY